MSGPARELPRWVDIGLIPLLNLLAALIITGLVFLAIGESPLESLGIMLNGAFGYGSGLGYTLFYIKGTLPPHIGMDQVYRGVMPFFFLQLLGLAICLAWPDLVTTLPRMMLAR